MITEGAAPHRDEYWPVETKETAGGEVTTRTLGDLGADLKTACLDALRLGSANTDTVYYKAMRAVDGQYISKTSSGFMRSTSVTGVQRKYVLQYLTGTLFTRKMAARMKLCNSGACLLCGEPDGGHHALSACSSMSKVVELEP